MGTPAESRIVAAAWELTGLGAALQRPLPGYRVVRIARPKSLTERLPPDTRVDAPPSPLEQPTGVGAPIRYL